MIREEEKEEEEIDKTEGARIEEQNEKDEMGNLRDPYDKLWRSPWDKDP